MNSLVQELFPGPIDVIGDVHGDLGTLDSLLSVLGYDSDGNHPESRKVVFVGDLTDRGPDSPGVVEKISRWAGLGRAQSVLGNHDLNILLGERKWDNGWFFGHRERLTADGRRLEKRADASEQQRTVDFFASLPLVLQRDDVRIVHACWQPEMVAMASQWDDVVSFYQNHSRNINLGLSIRSDLADWQAEQRRQNLNPVKVLTSGLEVRAPRPVWSSGKLRLLERYPWWEDDNEESLCLFGHYQRPRGVARHGRSTFCLDFGNSRRWYQGDHDPTDPDWRLAAARLPERQLLFDNGDTEPLPVG